MSHAQTREDRRARDTGEEFDRRQQARKVKDRLVARRNQRVQAEARDAQENAQLRSENKHLK